MQKLKDLLWDGLSFSGDLLCQTATIVTRKPKSEMDKKTLHYLFYLAAHKNIRNEMVFSVTEKDLADLGLEAYDVIDCLCDLSYCNGVINGMLHPVVRSLVVKENIIQIESPYFYFLFSSLCELGSPQDILQSIDCMIRGGDIIGKNY